MNQTSSRTMVVLILAGSCYLAGGCSDSESNDVFVVAPGIVAGDFKSIADYLADPVVQEILLHMPRYSGLNHPDMTGTYSSNGTVTYSTFNPEGIAVNADFCFGPTLGSLLDVVVQDPSVVDDGANSFIEGTGDSFTVYTAFKSVQDDGTGATCEIHEVNVFSGRKNADGSISDLFIGQGIVGILGPCADSLFVGDVQVSDNTAARTGDSCTGGPGTGDPTQVTVIVENSLVVDLLVFVDDETVPSLFLPAESTDSFETDPGFSLYFETLQPIAGQDDLGNDLPMGEVIAGVFPVDLASAGDSSTYGIENAVGFDEYFAPLPLNQTRSNIFSVANVGLDIPGYPLPPGVGLDCLCLMAPSPDPYVIGYYSYFLPGIVLPEQANVQFFFEDNETSPFLIFNGAFDLDIPSGTVTLLVQ